jgi:uncharacterized protein (DUF1800 family)
MAATAVFAAVWAPAYAAQHQHHHKKAAAAAAPVAPPISEDDKILHVLNRMGFGARPDDVEMVKEMGLHQYIEQQLNPEQIDDSALDQKLSAFPDLMASDQDIESKYNSFIAADLNAFRLRVKLQNMVAVNELKNQAASGTGTGQATGSTMDMTMTATAAANQAGGANKVADRAKKRDEVMDLLASNPDLQQQFKDTGDALKAASQPVGNMYQEFVTAKMMRAAESKKQFEEVMTDFWTNHFNIDIRKTPCGVLKVIDDRDVIRAHEFGKFRDLLEASAKSPAMLVYLDNFQSVADGSLPAPGQARPRINRLLRGRTNFGPFTGGGGYDEPMQTQMQAQPLAPPKPKRPAPGLNENYAREIMELHTLGVDGGYTQHDVREVARCLTGWGVSSADGRRARINRYAEAGEFQFFPRVHDDGEKVVLGHVIPAGGGIQDGETVLDILANDPNTMRHISYELCMRLVCDEPPMSLVNKCIDTWKRTDGDLREIYRTIVTSPEFFSPVAFHKKIKSPFEYAISSVRAMNGTVDATVAVAPRQVERDAALLVRPPQGGGFIDVNPTTLEGEIANMGEPLFQYLAPTGFPEDSRKWVSSGALISRLNFSLALTAGRIRDVKIDNPAEDASPTMDVDGEVNRLAAQILHGEMTPSTRATLMNEASSSSTTGTQGNASLTPATIAALLLGSPEFQRR